MERGLKNLADDIFKEIEISMNETNALYKEFSGAFFKKEDTLLTKLAAVVIKLIPILGQIFHFSAEKEILTDKLETVLNNGIKKIKNKIDEQYQQAKSLLPQ
jgi:predicted transcriptional regulator